MLLSRPYVLPALSTVAVALLGVAGLLWAMSAFQSELVLPIDDGYIHLALARTLAERGVWSIDPDGSFSSPSSSPGWVEAAAITGRAAMASFIIRSLASSAGGAGTSSLRLPVIETRGAPSSE